MRLINCFALNRIFGSRSPGLEVDLSTAGLTAGTARPQLGLAQVQELREAVQKFAEAKKQAFGENGYKLIAYTDTFGMRRPWHTLVNRHELTQLITCKNHSFFITSQQHSTKCRWNHVAAFR